MGKTTTDPPEQGEGKRGQDGYLGYLLRQAANGYRIGWKRSCAQPG